MYQDQSQKRGDRRPDQGLKQVVEAQARTGPQHPEPHRQAAQAAAQGIQQGPAVKRGKKSRGGRIAQQQDPGRVGPVVLPQLSHLLRRLRQRRDLPAQPAA